MKLKQTIRRIIKEEVNKKFSKPSENTDKIINILLTKSFSNSKMYHILEGKTRHDFIWCKNGFEIAHLVLIFEGGDNKKTTKERVFKHGVLLINRNILQDIIDFVPLKRNYLKYKVEEWFEDKFLDVIQNEMGRQDLFIDEFQENINEPIVCVPPVEKPKDVSMEDMIEYILKTTLYNREEIEQREEEEPGWLEDIYLSKLRDEKLDNN